MKKMTCIKPTMLLVPLLSLAMACGKKSEPTSAPAADGTKQSQTSEATSAQAGNPSADLKPPDSSSAPVAAVPALAPPPAPPPPPKPVVIPAGTVITVRLSSALGSKSSQTGDPFEATVAEPVAAGGKTVISSGTSAAGAVVEAKAKGKIRGEARLKLALNK
jgi:hypothetical protein